MEQEHKRRVGSEVKVRDGFIFLTATFRTIALGGKKIDKLSSNTSMRVKSGVYEGRGLRGIKKITQGKNNPSNQTVVGKPRVSFFQNVTGRQCLKGGERGEGGRVEDVNDSTGDTKWMRRKGGQ